MHWGAEIPKPLSQSNTYLFSSLGNRPRVHAKTKFPSFSNITKKKMLVLIRAPSSPEKDKTANQYKIVIHVSSSLVFACFHLCRLREGQDR
mmetsp:Transcript_29733/g.62082  ORF Transcript_29733/g.62082 Transcript_29733/m.62082 type:complete len:91 (-) Transcript_29733:50-322(-)